MKKKQAWKKLLKTIKLVRTFEGKNGHLSDFIAKDRKKH